MKEGWLGPGFSLEMNFQLDTLKTKKIVPISETTTRGDIIKLVEQNGNLSNDFFLVTGSHCEIDVKKVYIRRLNSNGKISNKKVELEPETPVVQIGSISHEDPKNEKFFKRLSGENEF